MERFYGPLDNEGSIDSTGKNDHLTVTTKTRTAEAGFGLVHKF